MIFNGQQCPHGEVFNPISLQCEDSSICDLYDCLDEHPSFNIIMFSCQQGYNYYDQAVHNISLPKCCPYYISCESFWNYGQPPLAGTLKVSILNQYVCCRMLIISKSSQKCPRGQLFNPVTSQCDASGCGTITTTTTTTQRPIESCSSKTAADCSQRRDGFYAFSNCCQRFTVCLKGISYLGVFTFQ